MQEHARLSHPPIYFSSSSMFPVYVTSRVLGNVVTIRHVRIATSKTSQQSANSWRNARSQKPSARTKKHYAQTRLVRCTQ